MDPLDQEAIDQFENKLLLSDIYAGVCFRLAMKYSESGGTLFEVSVLSKDGEMISPYQDILNQVTK
jgi:hypothetical protein